jgi:hypothetical protein
MGADAFKIKIRRATIADIEIITRYRIIFLSETYGRTSPEKELALSGTMTEYFKRSLTDNSFMSWIAEYINKPVGFSGLVIREQPGNFEIPNGKTGYILNMFTIKEFRNKGICNLLLDSIIEESRTLHLDKLELHATAAGEPIYRKIGFTDPHDKALEIIL